ncbi:alpha/beta hydrolase family protein [Kitasatospora sp. RB6PN24]|uniref:alpha/beta hydrolase n=1 Tax=Kitasatospora humi TaxID=2893891 RepID=UPI001E49AEAB|nr:alpha/beta hydrolase [Kitasatospora humi]MCC9311306.1 alpha/beta hydrolase family protein [Kitasatospora humi]
MASPLRPLSSRLRRALSAALVTAALAVPAIGAAGPADVPAPAPTAPAALGAVDPAALADRYAATRTDIVAAERTAAAHGDRGRATALAAMADPARQFVFFDGRDDGRSGEVFGDLATARQIAVLVPGADTDLDSYERLRAGAAALERQLGDGSAVIAWLGYKTPSTKEPAILTADRADQAAPRLQRFVAQLRAARPDSRLSVLCHSYGSVVCGRAAAGLDVSDLVLFGSPGTGYDNVAALHTRATVWAGRGATDWIADVPHVKVELPFATVGFGTDPVSPAFGARVFAAGSGGHSDYLKPGSPALTGIVRIVLGRTPAPAGPGA